MNLFLAVLSDFSFILAMIFAGFGMGWLSCSIIAAEKLRRITSKTWHDASAYYARRYHALISKK